MAGWDREILAIEIKALIDLDFEVDLTGLEAPEIDILLDDDAEASGTPGPDDVIPEPRQGNAVSLIHVPHSETTCPAWAVWV